MEEKKFKLEGFGDESESREFEKRSAKSGTKQSTKQPAKKFVLDDSVTIRFTISPRKLLKWGLVILVLLCVFFLGRYSASISCESTVNAPSVEVTDTITNEGSLSKVGGFFKSLFGGSSTTGGITAENNTTTAVATEEVDSAAVEETTEETAEETPEAIAEVAEEGEPIITSYNKVALSLGEVSVDWKETWGKIKSFQYTIKNNEAGTIEPDHFVMMVEGYDDLEKIVPLPKSSKSLKAGVTASSYSTVPNGFSYSELSAGDLSSVDVTIIMYDASGKEMAQIKKSVDLSG